MSHVIALALCIVSADSEWIVMKPVGGSFFAVELHSDVVLADDQVTLRNRGTLLSRRRFPSGVTVACDWKWTTGDEKGNYHDQLAIVLATDGRQRAWSHEVYDGVLIRFNPSARSVGLERWVDGRDDAPFATTAKNIEFTRDRTYHIRIVDNGRTITVFLDESEVLTADIADRSASRVAIYNREPVSGDPKESVLTDLTIVEPK